jgi:hypothetical protein
MSHLPHPAVTIVTYRHFALSESHISDSQKGHRCWFWWTWYQIHPLGSWYWYVINFMNMNKYRPCIILYSYYNLSPASILYSTFKIYSEYIQNILIFMDSPSMYSSKCNTPVPVSSFCRKWQNLLANNVLIPVKWTMLQAKLPEGDFLLWPCYYQKLFWFIVYLSFICIVWASDLIIWLLSRDM